MNRMILAESHGQLGNQLFLFAHLIALSEELGLPFYNAPFTRYRQHFVGSRLGLVPCYDPGKRLPDGAVYRGPVCRLAARVINISARAVRRLLPRGSSWVDHVTCSGVSPEYDIDLHDLYSLGQFRPARTTFLFGWRFRNYTLLKKHGSIIRRYFQFSDDLDATNFIARLRDRGKVVVSVHVRHGDYRTHFHGKYYMDLEEYAAFALGVADQVGRDRTVLVICSNEPQDLKGFGDVEVINGPGSMISDLQVMAMSDYILAPPSTFSRWASYFGQVPLAYIGRAADPVDVSALKPASC